MIADYRGRVDRLFATAIHADLRRAALPAKRVAFINFSAALVARMAHVVRVTRLKATAVATPSPDGFPSSSENLEVEQDDLQGDTYALTHPGGGFIDPVLTLNTAPKYNWHNASPSELASTLLHELSHVYGTEDDDSEGVLVNAYTIEDEINGIAKIPQYRGILLDCGKALK